MAELSGQSLRAGHGAAVEQQSAADPVVHVQVHDGPRARRAAPPGLAEPGRAGVIAGLDGAQPLKPGRRYELREVDVGPAEVGGLDEPQTTDRGGQRCTDRGDPPARPAVRGAQPSAHRAADPRPVAAVSCGETVDDRAAELDQGQLPALVGDRDRGHQRSGGMRHHRVRRTTSGARGRCRDLGQQARVSQPSDGVGGQPAGDAQGPHQRRPGRPRTAVDGIEDRGRARPVGGRFRHITSGPEYIILTTFLASSSFRRTAAALGALAAATFVFVTTETQPVALLDPLSRSLHVSPSTIGLLMSAYAVLAGLTAIPLTFASSGIRRRPLLLACVAVLSLSQAIAAIAPTVGPWPDCRRPRPTLLSG
ncbi:MAG: hypothetical protein ABI355_11770 [Solirubrobacteraceae bacterium]